MKKIYLLTFAVIFSVSNSFSDLPPNGSIIPDFTATDINGNETNSEKVGIATIEILNVLGQSTLIEKTHLIIEDNHLKLNTA